VDAAARVAGSSAIVPALVESTGLSPEGVALALREHLELDATDAELDALLDAATPAPRVHVVLSANVFVGALRALVLARAAAAVVTVRPSRREPVFARALIEELADPAVTVSDAAIEDVTTGVVHVYGRDATIAELRARARVPVVGHGTGMGVAWLPAGTDLRAAAELLARDVVPFEQRGCLSPRLAFVDGDGPAFAALLADALEAVARAVPRGALGADERADAARWGDAIAIAGTLHRRGSALVGFADQVLLPPTGRVLQVVPADREKLAALARFITVVGAPTLAAAEAIAPPGARRSLLGAMQRPRLDGPVDRRG
jgi:hypothetical protein